MHNLSCLMAGADLDFGALDHNGSKLLRCAGSIAAAAYEFSGHDEEWTNGVISALQRVMEPELTEGEVGSWAKALARAAQLRPSMS